MFDQRFVVTAEDQAALRGKLSDAAPDSSADAYRRLPGVLADGDDTPEAIHARVDLALLSAAEGLMESALYQIDELTKDARRVADAPQVPNRGLVKRADAARDAIEGAAGRCGA